MRKFCVRWWLTPEMIRRRYQDVLDERERQHERKMEEFREWRRTQRPWLPFPASRAQHLAFQRLLLERGEWTPSQEELSAFCTEEYNAILFGHAHLHADPRPF